MKNYEPAVTRKKRIELRDENLKIEHFESSDSPKSEQGIEMHTFQIHYSCACEALRIKISWTQNYNNFLILSAQDFDAGNIFTVFQWMVFQKLKTFD